jgi:hypothetical protein
VRFLFFLLSIVIIACKNDTPQNAPIVENTFSTEGGVIRQVFLQRFPKAEDVYFDSLETGYEISFNEGNNDRMASYDKTGQFLYVTTYIENDSLPPDAENFLNTKYKNAQLNIINAVENDKELHYVAEIETAENYIILEFDKNGKLLRESKNPLSKKEMQQREEEGVDDN